jgi:hypothetical protein
MTRPSRILLGQLGSFGDCLYVTAIARQIKEDYPGCQLTWAIGTPYRSILDGNPHVDRIWEVPFKGRQEMDAAWRSFEREARERYRAGEFDHIFLTQLGPNNYQNFDGTIRPSLFRGYPRPITVPITPVLCLSEREVNTVREFAETHRLATFRDVVLFECMPASGQSFVTPAFSLAAARRVLQLVPDTAFVLSSRQPIDAGDPRIIDASSLDFRANAELTKYCSLIAGCSSGISWLCTSSGARPLPMIQMLKHSTSVFASMITDAEYFGLPVDHILEMYDCSEHRLAECLVTALQTNFAQARRNFHERIPVTLDSYLEVFMLSVLKQGQPLKVLRSLRLVANRFGRKPFGDYLRTKFDSL